MKPELIIELVGYFASVMVLVSLLMSSVVKLRIINSIGSAVYVVYALIIGSYPTALLNLGLVIVNIYFLIKMLKNKKVYSVQRLEPSENGLSHFLAYYQEDIRQFLPEYDGCLNDEDRIYMVYSGADPAGVFVGRADGKAIRVRLDYSAPQFRDCSVGKFLYAQLKEEGVSQLIAQASTDSHKRYLKKMHFQETNGTLIKTL